MAEFRGDGNSDSLKDNFIYERNNAKTTKKLKE